MKPDLSESPSETGHLVTFGLKISDQDKSPPCGDHDYAYIAETFILGFSEWRTDV